jgi:hypothetical protein
MVTNSFGERNFMQPMGRLSMNSKCIVFFSFKVWGGGGRRIFSFYLCSQHVPFKFPLGSPRLFPIAPHFNLICFA